MLLGCLLLLHLPHAVMSFSLFPIFISLVGHQCLHSALLLHLLLCLTAHLLSGEHFSICLFVSKKKKTLNLHFSLYSFYCLSYSLHAANTQSRWIKGIPPCLISFRIIFHRHLKINFLFKCHFNGFVLYFSWFVAFFYWHSDCQNWDLKVSDHFVVVVVVLPCELSWQNRCFFLNTVT